MEHAYYSVESTRGCAAILWKDRAYSDQAAEALKITGTDLIDLKKLADAIIHEPQGGAHADPAQAATYLKTALPVEELQQLSPDELQAERYEKFRAIGFLPERSS